ncbi:MAG: hypothetical protein Q4G51_15540 [Dermatophilus congolensis]|nr:hypothetical protein [Dermatophilus congolensis]
MSDDAGLTITLPPNGVRFLRTVLATFEELALMADGLGPDTEGLARIARQMREDIDLATSAEN